MDRWREKTRSRSPSLSLFFSLQVTKYAGLKKNVTKV